VNLLHHDSLAEPPGGSACKRASGLSGGWDASFGHRERELSKKRFDGISAGLCETIINNDGLSFKTFPAATIEHRNANRRLGTDSH
jgi:hypothetical protein